MWWQYLVRTLSGIRSRCLLPTVWVRGPFSILIYSKGVSVETLTSLRATGGIISGASPAYNIEEMTFALRTAQAKVLMTAPSALSVAIPAAKNAGIPQDRIILLEGKKAGFTTIQDLVALGESFGPSGQVQPFKIPTGQTNKDLCGFLSFSSGTTGLPKAVSRWNQCCCRDNC